MNFDNRTPADPSNDNGSASFRYAPTPDVRKPEKLCSCAGECLERARNAYEAASTSAKLDARNAAEISKRFQFLRDAVGKDRHKEAEVLLENAVALYEAAFGQEHPTVANLMLELAALNNLHGNDEYAKYLSTWAGDILNAKRDEPTHEFFALFGYDEPAEDAPLH
jgi:hypothetical protein